MYQLPDTLISPDWTVETALGRCVGGVQDRSGEGEKVLPVDSWTMGIKHEHIPFGQKR